MLLKRAMFRVMFPAAVVLPLYLFIARGIVLDDVGSGLLLYFVACPVVFLLLGAIGTFIIARKSTRAAGAVSWIDAGVLGVVYLALIAAGVFATSLMVVVVIVLLLAAFWFTLWEFARETRTRVRQFVGNVEASAPAPSSTIPPARGETIIITPKSRP